MFPRYQNTFRKLFSNLLMKSIFTSYHARVATFTLSTGSSAVSLVFMTVSVSLSCPVSLVVVFPLTVEFRAFSVAWVTVPPSVPLARVT